MVKSWKITYITSTYRKERTENPTEDSTTKNTKKCPIPDNPREEEATVSLRILNRTLSLAKLERTLSMGTLERTLSLRVLERLYHWRPYGGPKRGSFNLRTFSRTLKKIHWIKSRFRKTSPSEEMLALKSRNWDHFLFAILTILQSSWQKWHNHKLFF